MMMRRRRRRTRRTRRTTMVMMMMTMTMTMTMMMVMVTMACDPRTSTRASARAVAAPAATRKRASPVAPLSASRSAPQSSASSSSSALPRSVGVFWEAAAKAIGTLRCPTWGLTRWSVVTLVAIESGSMHRGWRIAVHGEYGCMMHMNILVNVIDRPSKTKGAKDGPVPCTAWQARQLKRSLLLSFFLTERHALGCLVSGGQLH
jgi:hypothetical protein